MVAEDVLRNPLHPTHLGSTFSSTLAAVWMDDRRGKSKCRAGLDLCESLAENAIAVRAASVPNMCRVAQH